jgi:hypothetical protein
LKSFLFWDESGAGCGFSCATSNTSHSTALIELDTHMPNLHEDPRPHLTTEIANQLTSPAEQKE